MFADAAELKVKESDRIATMVAALRSLGAAGRSPARTAWSSHGGRAGPWPAERSTRPATTAWPWPWPWPRWRPTARGRIRVGRGGTSYPRFEEDYQRCVS